MNTFESSHMETSAVTGACFIALGIGIWFGHYSIGIFTSWAWAALIGNLWVIAGTLLMFSDVRMYQFERSPVEQLLIEHEE